MAKRRSVSNRRDHFSSLDKLAEQEGFDSSAVYVFPDDPHDAAERFKPDNVDLLFLWRWWCCLDHRRNDPTPLNEREREVYRPDPNAYESLQKFSIKYSYSINKMDEFLGYADSAYESWTNAVTEQEKSDCECNFRNTIRSLEAKVVAGMKHIAEAEYNTPRKQQQQPKHFEFPQDAAEAKHIFQNNSDLLNLWYWWGRLETTINKERNITKHDGGLFRPHVAALNSLPLLNKINPVAIKQIHEYLGHVESMFSEWESATDDDKEKHIEAYEISLAELAERIQNGIKVIADQPEPKAKEPAGSTEETQKTKSKRLSKDERNKLALTYIEQNATKEYKVTVRELASFLASKDPTRKCSPSTACDLPAWKVYSKEYQRVNPPKPKAIPYIEGEVGKDDSALQKLIGESEADYEPSPLDDDEGGNPRVYPSV